MRTYPAVQPDDQYGNGVDSAVLQTTALARDVVAVTSSAYIELDPETTFVTIHAVAKDVFVKWAGGDNPSEDYCTSDNFDEMVESGSHILCAIPKQDGGSKFDGIQVVGRESGGTVVVVQK